MKNFLHNNFIVCIVLLLLACSPRLVMAQRFNHGSMGGGGRPSAAPASRPAAYNPPPSRPQPAPRQQATPRQQPAPRQQAAPESRQPEMNRPGPTPRPESINGGSRNFGNHDLSR